MNISTFFDVRSAFLVVRLGAVLIMAIGVAFGTSACSILGVPMNQQLSTEGNLANQKKVATEFIKRYPHPELESVRFTAEGSFSGSGNWAANAVVTVAGNAYEEILGTSLSGGDPLPTAPTGSHAGPVTVIYSDGTREVVQ